MLISSNSIKTLGYRLESERKIVCKGLYLSARWFVLSSTALSGVHFVILPDKESAEYCANDLYSLVEGDKVFFLPESGKSVERSNYKSSLGVQRTAAVGVLLSLIGIFVVRTREDADMKNLIQALMPSWNLFPTLRTYANQF